MSDWKHTIQAKTEWITIDLNKPLPWWAQPYDAPLKDRVMVHDDRRKARRKGGAKQPKRRRRRAG